MQFLRKHKGVMCELGLFLAVFLASFTIFSFVIRPNDALEETHFSLASEKSLHLVAVGDSLTEGVGDTTKQGGFVPIVGALLTSENPYLHVATQNFGVSGNTSTQIITRVREKEDLRQAIERCDIVTITVGGNDIMKVIREHIANLTKSDFEKPKQAYQSHLIQLINEIRELNTKAPIYVLGVYNPFYVNFSEITEMQDIIDAYNDATRDILKGYSKCFFVPINQVLYKGTDERNEEEKNDLVSDEDQFHPNNTGYQMMAREVLKKMNETKKIWFPK